MRSKPLREKLHEANNANIGKLVEDGFKSIDRLTVRGLRELERRGVTGMDEVAADLASAAKKLLLRGISVPPKTGVSPR